jgi:hypothetical protein
MMIGLENLEADDVQRGHARLIISFPSLHTIDIATWLVPSRPKPYKPAIPDWRWLNAAVMQVWRRLKPGTTALTRTPHPSIRKFFGGNILVGRASELSPLAPQFASKSAAELAADGRLQPIKPWKSRAKVMHASVPRSPHCCC